MNRYKYVDDVRDALVRAGIMSRPIDSPMAQFAIGLGLGLVVGAGIAMLFAPRTGAEIREKISGKARELASRVPSAVSGVREAMGVSGEKLPGEYRDVPIR